MQPDSVSPFDDDAPEITPRRRTRRPWWRYNLVTLAFVLFLLAWIRELLVFSPRVTWVCVLAVFTIWVVLPDVVPHARGLARSFRRGITHPLTLRLVMILFLIVAWYFVLSLFN